MNFQCEELTISDEEFGCTIIFSDSKSSDDQFMSIEEIINSEEKYLLIQRTYPEDDDEIDNYHIESSETDIELISDDINVTIAIDRKRFRIDLPKARLEIGLNLTDQELENLVEIFVNRFNERLRLKKK